MKSLSIRLALAFTLCACTSPHKMRHEMQSTAREIFPKEVAQVERKAYAECAVRIAFSVALPDLSVAGKLAWIAMRACESQRHALYAGLHAYHYGQHAAAQDAENRATAHLDQIEAALAARLTLHLRQTALRNGTLATSGSSI